MASLYSSGQGMRPSTTDIGLMIYLHERTLSVGITGGLALVTCTHAFGLLHLPGLVRLACARAS